MLKEIRRKIKEECLEKEDPFCTAACPFRLDIREFTARIKRGSFKSALRLYSNTVGFPAIVANLCDEPCRLVCPRESIDGHILLKLLEQAVIAHCPGVEPNSYNLPPKGKRVAVIGAGPGGLACALRLANRKYQVDIFEQDDRIGGHLWQLLEPEIFLADLKRQFSQEDYGLYLNRPVENLEPLLEHYDALYLATGAGGNSFGLLKQLAEGEGAPLASHMEGVFLGGTLLGAGTMEALSQGFKASLCIEDYLKTGLMRSAVKRLPTKMFLDPTVLAPLKPVLPVGKEGYSREEAVAEASRCIQCRCDACYRSCAMMHYFKKFPSRIAEEVEITITPGTLDGDGTVATRLISTCNQCGLCAEVCPVSIDMGEFLRASHQAMHEKGAMPWVFHQFWLRDMAFANSDRAALVGAPPGREECRYLFFPGCQLGASNPRYVTEAYSFLLEFETGTALKLGCCGAPAVWAGDMTLFKEVREQIMTIWNELDRPLVVLACPSCAEIFSRYLPELEAVLIYDLIARSGIKPAENGVGLAVSVFDPCSSRHRPETQQAVRQLIKSAGYALEPLPYEGKQAQCCSYGGQISIASPAYSSWLVKKRAAEGESPYITYCSNCRDIFMLAGKQVRHILEIVFGLEAETGRPPSLDDRRRRREILKAELVKKFWPGIEISKKEEQPCGGKKVLNVADELRAKMNREHLLEEDALAIIDYCETSGRRVYDPACGHYFGCREIGYMTQWVEYAPLPGGFTLFNTYAHKMKAHSGEGICGGE